MLWKRLRLTLDMIKFEHSVFALPFALTGALLAFRDGGYDSAEIGGKLAWIVVAMVGARSAAMAFNRLVDASIDARNPRTSMRHLPAGMLSRGFGWGFVVAASALFFVAAAALNPLCLKLAPVALGIVFFYSFTKRFTSFSHLVLGFSLGIAPAAAWIAVRGSLDPRILWLTAAVTFWTAGFDVIYSCQDFEFDRAEGLFSVPRALGIAGALRAAQAAARAHDRLPAGTGVFAASGRARAGGRGGDRRPADLRALPGESGRSVARQRSLLHHEWLCQRVILYVLGC